MADELAHFDVFDSLRVIVSSTFNITEYAKERQKTKKGKEN